MQESEKDTIKVLIGEAINQLDSGEIISTYHTLKLLEAYIISARKD